MKKILIIGTGVLGSNVLDMVLQSDCNHEFIVAGKDLNKTKLRTNLSEFAALNLGYKKNVSYLHLDLNEIEQTAEKLYQLKPDIIFNATTMMSYWVPTKLPKEIFDKLYYAYTGWQTPMHLTLAYKLMKALSIAGVSSRVINASYPDVINPALSKVGLEPEIGIGNVANVTPVIKKATAMWLGESVENIEVKVVAHHHFSYRLPSLGNATDLPYNIEVNHKGKDITHEIDLDDVFKLLPTKLKRTRGLEGMIMTAASAASVILSMANENNHLVHAPGPNGLPGGYPVRINSDRTELVLPKGVSLKEAISTNVEGQILDGVKEIDDEGNIYYSDKEMDIIKDLLGYECRSMNVSDSEYYAKYLKERLEYISNKEKANLIIR